MVKWDGSFDGKRAGVGVWIRGSSTGQYVRVALPVYASDATRCEALGPAVASLLL